MPAMLASIISGAYWIIAQTMAAAPMEIPSRPRPTRSFRSNDVRTGAIERCCSTIM